MIHEEICTYDVCKLAKEKGFNEYEACNHIYEDDEQWYTLTTYTNAKGIDWSKDKFTVAPTQSLLQRWLREEKHCNIEIAVCPAPISIWIFVWSVSYGTDSHYSHRCNYDTYEQALEDALRYALKKLV